MTAQFNLGVLFYLGSEVTPKDVDTATEWFVEVMAQNDPKYQLRGFINKHPELLSHLPIC